MQTFVAATLQILTEPVIAEQMPADPGAACGRSRADRKQI